MKTYILKYVLNNGPSDFYFNKETSKYDISCLAGAGVLVGLITIVIYVYIEEQKILPLNILIGMCLIFYIISMIVVIYYYIIKKIIYEFFKFDNIKQYIVTKTYNDVIILNDNNETVIDSDNNQYTNYKKLYDISNIDYFDNTKEVKEAKKLYRGNKFLTSDIIFPTEFKDNFTDKEIKKIKDFILEEYSNELQSCLYIKTSIIKAKYEYHPEFGYWYDNKWNSSPKKEKLK